MQQSRTRRAALVVGRPTAATHGDRECQGRRVCGRPRATAHFKLWEAGHPGTRVSRGGGATGGGAA